MKHPQKAGAGGDGPAGAGGLMCIWAARGQERKSGEELVLDGALDVAFAPDAAVARTHQGLHDGAVFLIRNLHGVVDDEFPRQKFVRTSHRRALSHQTAGSRHSMWPEQLLHPPAACRSRGRLANGRHTKRMSGQHRLLGVWRVSYHRRVHRCPRRGRSRRGNERGLMKCKSTVSLVGGPLRKVVSPRFSTGHTGVCIRGRVG